MNETKKSSPKVLNYIAMGKRIRRLRAGLNMTQKEAAKKMGISLSYYGHIERGSRVPSIETLMRVSSALGVSLDSLIFQQNTGEDKKTRILHSILRVLSDSVDQWLPVE